MKKIISILGSTGSIGSSSLSIIDKEKNYFNIQLLSANKNFNLIIKQIKKYKPKYFVISNKEIFNKVFEKIKTKKTKILNNFNSIKLKKNNILILAIPGIAGLKPTISMMSKSKKILIANKESIICGWDLIKKKSLKNKIKIIPVDSEHYSIFKLISNHQIEEIEKIYITASGGPFLDYKKNLFKKIKPNDALKHPKWKMGRKITVDSATLMNKVFELVEAQKLFNLPKKKIDILVHPESLVHAIVKFKNGLTKFIYHETSMVIPLANAIFENDLVIDKFFKKNRKKINFQPIENLTFKKINYNKFPIKKILSHINKYTSSPIIINAANEILVDYFLAKKISFLAIYETILAVINDRNFKKYAIRSPINITQIEKIDSWARKTTLKKILYI